MAKEDDGDDDYEIILWMRGFAGEETFDLLVMVAVLLYITSRW